MQRGCRRTDSKIWIAGNLDEAERNSKDNFLMHLCGQDTLVFDYDGVVADTEPLHWKTWAKVLEPRGFQLTWEQYCKFGRGVQDAEMIATLSTLYNDRSLPSGLDELITRHNRLMKETCASALPIRNETVELLHSLKNFRLGLVTGSSRSEVAPVLRAAGVFDCFNAMVFRDDVEHHKPAPDPYLLLGSLLGITSGLAFEDSAAGIASAQGAGFIAIPVDAPEHLPMIVQNAIRKQQT